MHGGQGVGRAFLPGRASPPPYLVHSPRVELQPQFRPRIDRAGNPVPADHSHFPELALQMLDIRFAHGVKAVRFNQPRDLVKNVAAVLGSSRVEADISVGPRRGPFRFSELAETAKICAFRTSGSRPSSSNRISQGKKRARSLAWRRHPEKLLRRGRNPLWTDHVRRETEAAQVRSGCLPWRLVVRF